MEKLATLPTGNSDELGLNLLHFCKVQNLLIANGRVGKDKNIGNFSTKNDTLIDYCLANPGLFQNIADFEMEEFNPLLSDVHCALSLSIKSNKLESNSKTNTNFKKFVYNFI